MIVTAAAVVVEEEDYEKGLNKVGKVENLVRRVGKSVLIHH